MTDYVEGESGLLGLRQEVKSLRDQLQRALVELKAYQTKYPSAYIHDIKLDDNLPPWITSSEIMTPLLEAYDSRIKELESIATQQAIQLEKFRSKVQDVVRENEHLRGAGVSNTGTLEFKNTNNFQSSSASEDHDDDIDDDETPLGGLKEELVNELNERMEILMTENSLINEQKGLLVEELEAFQRELDIRTQEFDEVSNKCIEFESKASQLQHLLQQTENDRDSAANKAIHFSESLGNVQAQFDTLKTDHHNLRKRSEQLDRLLHEEQIKYQQYKAQVEKEGVDCVILAQRAEERAQELKTQLNSKTAEFESTQEILRKLRREYQATRQDAEGMLQVMSSLERQVAEYAAKEEEVAALSRECKEKVDDALTARDQAVVREEQVRREVARLMEQRKQFQLNRQDEIKEAVDAALKTASERMASLERDMETVAEAMGKKQAEADISIRDAKSWKDQLDRCVQLRDNERRAAESAAKEVELKMQTLLEEQNATDSQCRHAQNANIHFRSTIDSLRSQISDIQLELMQSHKSRESEVTALKSALREAQLECKERGRLQTKAERDFEELKEKFKVEIMSAERRLGDENKVLRKRALETERTVRELEQNLEMNTVRRSHLVESVKETSSAVVSQLESQLMEEKEISRDLSLVKREFEIRVEALERERVDMKRLVGEADKTIGHLEKELLDTRRMVVDLTQQLSESFEARKTGALNAARKMEKLGADLGLRAIYADDYNYDESAAAAPLDDDDNKRLDYAITATHSRTGTRTRTAGTGDGNESTRAQAKLRKSIDLSNKKIAKTKKLIDDQLLRANEDDNDNDNEYDDDDNGDDSNDDNKDKNVRRQSISKLKSKFKYTEKSNIAATTTTPAAAADEDVVEDEGVYSDEFDDQEKSDSIPNHPGRARKHQVDDNEDEGEMDELDDEDDDDVEEEVEEVNPED